MKAKSSIAFCGLALLLALPAPSGEKDFGNQFQKWNYRDGADKVNIQGVNSITRTLEKWGRSIFSEGKNILMNQPQSILPDFSRMRPLSEALDDLLKEINSLKKRIAELNDRLDIVRRIYTPIRYSAVGSKRPSVYPLKPPQMGRDKVISGRRRVNVTQHPRRPFTLKKRVYIRRIKKKN